MATEMPAHEPYTTRPSRQTAAPDTRRRDRGRFATGALAKSGVVIGLKLRPRMAAGDAAVPSTEQEVKGGEP